MEREITNLYYNFIRRLSNLLCHNPGTIYPCCSSFCHMLIKTYKHKTNKQKIRRDITYFYFFRITLFRTLQKLFPVSIIFCSLLKCLALFPPVTHASPWSQEKSSINSLTCAQLSHSRACTLFPFLTSSLHNHFP